MPHGCGIYLVSIIYVPSGKSIVGAVRALEAIGSRIVDVDEELRRIVVNVSIGKYRDLMDVCRRYESQCSMEVKASCRWTPRDECLRVLGFRRVRGKSGTVYYGVFGERIIEVEVAGERSKIKVGGYTKSRIIHPPLPPGIFILEPEDASSAAKTLEEFLDSVVDDSGCRGK